MLIGMRPAGAVSNLESKFSGGGSFLYGGLVRYVHIRGEFILAGCFCGLESSTRGVHVQHGIVVANRYNLHSGSAT